MDRQRRLCRRLCRQRLCVMSITQTNKINIFQAVQEENLPDSPKAGFKTK